ncbi:MAG: diguanylate cyclase [Phycisphaerae bacterium]
MRENVLIVDDNPDALDLLEALLASWDCFPRRAVNGIDALRKMEESNPDMIITDWCMPEMDGLELCRQIRKRPNGDLTYIIILTVNDGEDEVVKALNAGADDYLSKPFNRRELHARMQAGQRIITMAKALNHRNRTLFLKNNRLGNTNQKLTRQATVDELTGLTNFRGAQERLGEYWNLARRHNQSIAVILMDLDHFKDINDHFGHLAGNAVLKEVADTLRKSARAEEVVCRIGGEEFLVLCPGAKAQSAAVGAERFRKAIESHEFFANGSAISITLSAGVAEYRPEMVNLEDLFQTADNAMYEAKHTGRNAVCQAMK